MARRRRPQYNQTLGGDWKKGLSAHEINIRDSNGNLLNEDSGDDYNQAAANQFRSVENARLAAVAKDDQTAMDKVAQKQSYEALAASLGVKVAQPKDVWDESTQRYTRPKATGPNFEQLKSAFYSLPPEKQADIYKKGGARFIDGEAGAKMIQGVAKTQDEAMNTGINSIVGQVTRGEVVHDPADRKFYRTIKDPNDPMGQKTMRVPISLLEAKYMQMAMQKGMMPDVDQLSGGNAVPAASPTMGPGLADTKTVPANGLERPRPMFGPPAALAGPLPSQVDTATRLGAGLRNSFTSGGAGLLSPVEDRVNDFAQTFPGDVRNAGAHVVNALSGGVNAVGRFASGLFDTPTAQIPQIPYETVQSNLLAQPNRQAAVQSAIASSLAQPAASVDPMNALRNRVQTQVPAGPDQQAYMDWIENQRVDKINSNLATSDY